MVRKPGDSVMLHCTHLIYYEAKRLRRVSATNIYMSNVYILLMLTPSPFECLLLWPDFRLCMSDASLAAAQRRHQGIFNSSHQT
jgi:hypothetical protein